MEQIEEAKDELEVFNAGQRPNASATEPSYQPLSTEPCPPLGIL